jgi:hypothetical protein
MIFKISVKPSESSSTVPKIDPWSARLTWPKRKKSLSARCGEYGGCGAALNS